MFTKIMVPVDLDHLARLEKALTCAGALAMQFKAELIYVGVTSALPGSLAHNPAEYGHKLKAFADEQGARYGVACSSIAKLSHDVAVDVDHALLEAAEDSGADLAVMASHAPGFIDRVWPSHGGRLASHARISVMLVR
ncbi:universal stress protein [Pseudooceanicola algae]|uniref:UspA domain-containing protein n=1 Tax=Pseudooceanicola algae TaxID=1537215 RepID=A0A418SEG1_9RHOB|nr:universal stress protein [Pseudooceanicola algae]QPM89698.1 hypothetical protein PSAL_009230 [Pseudooceanicola algae]